MNHSIVLTVAIPTYNGAKYIHEAINSVIRQVSKTNNYGLELLISDNGSTDNTNEIVSRYQSEYPDFIVYFKNQKNLGYDANIDLLFKRARGQFVWILSDDDALYANALDYILNIIATYPNVKVIQSNFDIYDQTMLTKIHSMLIEKDVHCHDGNEFFSVSKGRYGLVSSLIINKEAWNRLDINDLIGCNYIHAGAILRILINSESYVVAQPLLKARIGSTNFEIDGNSMILVPARGINMLKEAKALGYARNLIKKLLFEQRKYVFKRISKAKKAGIDRRLVTKTLIKDNYDSLRFWFAMPIILMPDKIYCSLRSVFTNVKVFLKKTLSLKCMKRSVK